MIRSLTIPLMLTAIALVATPVGAFYESTTVSPRARAMGESIAAVPDGAFAAFHNPAHLAALTGGAVTATYVRPFRLSFTDFFYVGGALPMHSRYGNLGVGISHFKVAYDGVSLQQETQLTLAHGFNLFSDFHSTIDFGYALNLYSLDLGESVTGLDPGSDTSVGIDLGFSMLLHKRTRAGFQVKNINNPTIGIDNEELRQRLTAGLAYEPYEGVITTFEFDNELGEELQYHGGLEMTVLPGFALRAGVETNPSKLTGGFGYVQRNLGVDYGFSTGGGTLDSTHQFGLKYAWGGEAP